MTAKRPENDPGQIPLEGMPEPQNEAIAFSVDQRRAFGSVPGLLGRNIDIPAPERIADTAKTRVEPAVIERGLFGAEGRYAVDGIVLSSEEYTTVVRSPRSFQSSVQAVTTSANRMLTNDVRAKEKEIKSGKHALDSKVGRHEIYINALHTEGEMLAQLLEWQATPGFARTKQIDIYALAGQAWNITFRGMLHTLKDQYNLTAEEHVDMVNAMATRLFRGPQRDRVAYWGDMLRTAAHYNRAKSILFTHRQQAAARRSGQLAVQLNELHDANGIS